MQNCTYYHSLLKNLFLKKISLLLKLLMRSYDFYYQFYSVFFLSKTSNSNFSKQKVISRFDDVHFPLFYVIMFLRLCSRQESFLCVYVCEEGKRYSYNIDSIRCSQWLMSLKKSYCKMIYHHY